MNSGLKVQEILKQSFLLYKNNFLLFWGIIFLGNIVNIALRILGLYPGVNYPCPRWILLTLGFALSTWASIALIFNASWRYRHKEIGFKESFLMVTFERYLRYIAVSIGYLLLLIVGLFLFVAPGVYWGIAYSLATMVVVLEGKTIGSSFARSKDIIKGYFWKVGGVFLVAIVILFILPSIGIYYGNVMDMERDVAHLFFYLIGIFFIPFSMTAFVILYYTLIGIKGSGERIVSAPPIAKEQIRKRWIIVLVVLLILFYPYFLRTLREKSQLKEFKKEIVLSGGVELTQPQGWRVIKRTIPEESCKFVRFRYSYIREIKIWTVPAEKLKSLEDHKITDEILRELPMKFRRVEKINKYKFKSIEKIELNNGSWMELSLQRIGKPLGRVNILKNFYTICGEDILVVTYYYRVANREDENLLREEEEVKNIIGSLKWQKNNQRNLLK